MIPKCEIDLMLHVMPAWASDDIISEVNKLNDRSRSILKDDELSDIIRNTIDKICNVLDTGIVKIHIRSRTILASLSDRYIALSIVTHYANVPMMARVRSLGRKLMLSHFSERRTVDGNLG